MKQLIVADFSEIDETELERIFIAAALDHRSDRIVAFGPFGEMETAEHLFESCLLARSAGNDNGVVIIPSGEKDREIFLELKVRNVGDSDKTKLLDDIIRITDKVRSMPLDPNVYGTRKRISMMSYEGFEFMTGVMKFSKVKELIQTSQFAPHAFLSIIRPLYIASQDISKVWVVQPMPDTKTEYIHHRRLYTFKGIREETESANKVITLNKQERDLGVCHSYDMMIQEPGGAYKNAYNHDRAYATIMSFATPPQPDADRVRKGVVQCTPLSPGYAHLITVGRANQGHFTMIYTDRFRMNDLLIEQGLPPVDTEHDTRVPGIAFFNLHVPSG